MFKRKFWKSKKFMSCVATLLCISLGTTELAAPVVTELGCAVLGCV